MVRRPWLIVASTLIIAGWGSNQFAALMPVYRETYGFSQLSVTAMLGVYAIGLVPALLVGGMVSDKFGRKTATQLSVMLALLSSVILMFGVMAGILLFVGRFISGIATGVIMATATSWVKELSQPPYDEGATAAAGAKRAALSTASGFFLGPVIGGFVAQLLPYPEMLPYVLHIALSIPILVLLAKVPDTAGKSHGSAVSKQAASQLDQSRWQYPGARRRFWSIVGFGAPWAFMSGTISFAVIPQTLHVLGDNLLGYTTIAIACTLGFGIIAQPLATKIDTEGTARASVIGLMLTVVGLGLGILAGVYQLPWLGMISHCISGSAYGFMMSAGLIETQRLSAPASMGRATGIFYTLAYAGFLSPPLVAALESFFIERNILLAMLGFAMVSLIVITVRSRKDINPEIIEVAPVRAYAQKVS